ncbi:MAG: metal ABC transporter substrate-binding protein [Lachnospiraceae bacterium]
MKNRILSIAFVLTLCAGLLAGCGKGVTEAAKQDTAEDKISIVCTTFPQYDWVRELIGDETDRFELTLLLDNGVDLHSYQPTAEDIAKIGSSDIFIYVGGESDEWVEDALREATNQELRAVNLLEVLGDAVKEEEVVEGMEAEEEEESSEGGEEGPEYDEHVWLSLKNAKVLVTEISAVMENTVPEKAEQFAKNRDAYIQKLDGLDKEYEQIVQGASYQTLLFADRFPFRYMADDYGLDYYAAFVGCSAETEASFETITFLAQKTEELKLPAIFVIENSDKKIAETVKQSTAGKNQNILVLNSLQSITSTDISGGVTYLQAMKDNLEVLKQALN